MIEDYHGIRPPTESPFIEMVYDIVKTLLSCADSTICFFVGHSYEFERIVEKPKWTDDPGEKIFKQPVFKCSRCGAEWNN